MARIYSAGFELQSVTNGVEWDTTSGSPTINTTTKRSGSASLKCYVVNDSAWIRHQYALSAGITNSYYRFYLNIATSTSDLDTIFLLYSASSATEIVSIKLNSNRTLELWKEGVGTVQLGSDTSALTAGTWYRIELGVVGTTATAYIDGVEFATGTLNSGVPNRFDLGCVTTTTADLYFDDLAINNDSGTVHNGLPGAGSIIHFKPNSVGDVNECTSGDYASIDETTPDDGATIAVMAGNGDLFDVGCQSHVEVGISVFDTIRLVQVGIREAAVSNLAESWKLRIKSQASGTVLEGTETAHNDTTYRTNGDVQPRIYTLTSYVDPQAGGAWTPSLLDTMQIGVESVDANPDINISTLWALVEYVSSGITTSTSTTKSTSTSTTKSTSTSSTTTSSSTSTTVSTSTSTTTTLAITTSTSTSSTTTSQSTSTTRSTSTSTSSTTTSSSTSTTVSTSSSTSTSSTTTSSSTSTTKSTSTSTSSTTTSSSTSTTRSTSTSISTSSTTTSSSTTTTLPPSGSFAFGEQYPLEGETAVSWQTWSNGAGGVPTVVGDADWGRMQLAINDSEGRSDVYDLIDTDIRTYTLTENKYGAGANTATLQIRGSTSSFNQDDETPEWEGYSVPITRSWRYVQVREVKQ